MSGNLSLFGDDPPDEPVQPAPVEPSIADWLVEAIREALTAHGLTTMAERQQAIESVAGRPVESLRQLTRAEALRILTHLTPEPAAQTGSTSAWDGRDEDTWIDRL